MVPSVITLSPVHGVVEHTHQKKQRICVCVCSLLLTLLAADDGGGVTGAGDEAGWFLFKMLLSMVLLCN